MFEKAVLDYQDIRVTSYLPQSGHGAGGQQVGLTTSGVIVHHMPTGLGVSCDSERSQHANKEKALALLEALVVAVKAEESFSERMHSLRANQPTPEADEFARLMALATEHCPELIPTPILMNTPVSANNRTMANKVNMIKEVREKVGCGLKEAKEAVDEVYGYSVDFDDVILKATLYALRK